MFFNVIATPGLGLGSDVLKQAPHPYGQAEITINANPLNGNLCIKDFSKRFTAQGFSFSIAYLYNSQSPIPWRLNQAKVIVAVHGTPNTNTSFLIVEEADGYQRRYCYDSVRGCYVNLAAADAASTLTYTTEEGWQGYHFTRNCQEFYNKKNQLQRQCDASGNYLSYDYDQKGRLIAINCNEGGLVVIEYHEQTVRIYSVDGDKKRPLMHYLFDEHGRLLKTSIRVDAEQSYELHYRYAPSTGLLEHLSQSDQTELSFTYELRENSSYLSSIARGTEQAYHFTYQERRTWLSDPLGQETLFMQNNEGLLQKESRHQRYQEYAYDKHGRLKTIHYTDESVQQFSYDNCGLCSASIGRMQEKTLYLYDDKSGLLLCKTELLLSAGGVKQLNTFYVYNEQKQLIFKIKPNGMVYAYERDERGNCIRERVYLHRFLELSHLRNDSVIEACNLAAWCAQQDPAQSRLIEWQYDARGAQISKTLYAHLNQKGEGVHDEATIYEHYEWSAHGDLLVQKSKKPQQAWAIKSFEYDGMSRMTKEVSALGQISMHCWTKNQYQTTYLPTGLVVSLSRDSRGLIIYQQEQAQEYSSHTLFTYDSAGRVCIIEKDSGVKEYLVYDDYNRVRYAIDSLRAVIQNDYDSSNRLQHQSSFSQLLGFIDESALVKGQWLPELDGERCIESSFYDASGHLVCSINADNQVREHRYDARGNRIKTIEYAKAITLRDEQRAELSSTPECLASSQDKHHDYFYDEANELIGEQLSIGSFIAYTREVDAGGTAVKLSSKLSFLNLMAVRPGQFPI